MLKDYFEVPNKPAIKSGNVLSCDFTDHETFIPQPLDFTRNTLATYVDCNGLIKTSGVSDTELVTNGDFSNGSTDWSFQPAWSIANGKAFYDGTINSQRLKQDIVTDASKTYQIKFTISGVESGKFARFAVWVISNASSKFFTYRQFKDGEYVIYASPDGPNGIVLHFHALNAASNDSSFYITNISLKEVNLNVPRIDYFTEIGKAKELQKPSLLLEPQSTNIVEYSEDIDRNSGLSEVGSSIVRTNDINNPAGLKALSLLQENTANSSHFTFKDWSLTNPSTNTISVFAKSKGGRNLRFGDGGVGWSSGFNANFDLTAGTSDTGTIEDYGNGWFRCSVQGTANAATSRLIIYATDGTTTSYQGDGSSGVYLYGFQIEEQSYATSYIPTYGAIATRNGEICRNAGQLGVFPTISEHDGTFYGEFKGLTDVYGQYSLITINDDSASNLIGFGFNNVGNRLWIRCKKSNSTVIDDINQTYDVDKFQKVAIKFSPGSNSIYLNGNQIQSNTSNRAFNDDLDQFDFNFHTTQHYFYGRVREIKSFRRALTDSELTELTNNIV